MILLANIFVPAILVPAILEKNQYNLVSNRTHVNEPSEWIYSLKKAITQLFTKLVVPARYWPHEYTIMINVHC